MPTFTFIPRSYLHFDQPVNSTTAESFATNATAVSRHPFLPFIQYTIWSQKIRKKDGGGVEPKPPKLRPIAYASHRDAHIYGYYSSMLAGHYERALSDRGLIRAVTAFRPINRQSNIHFANEVFEKIRVRGECAVLATDISDYFGTVKHDRLNSAWCGILGVARLPDDHFKVFRSITEYALVRREKLCELLMLDPEKPRADGRRRYCTPLEFREVVRSNGLIHVNRTGAGIPQGSPISALLSNIYLLAFDTEMNRIAVEAGGLYRRYCDDILFVVPTAEVRDQARVKMVAMLTDLGLVAHPDKTELVDFTKEGDRLVTKKPLNYLGFTFDGLFKRIRPASIARFYKRMRAGVSRAKALRFKASRRAKEWKSLRKREIYVRYSYIGRRNFISYALRAAEIMNDSGIKKQVKAHWRKLKTLLDF